MNDSVKQIRVHPWGMQGSTHALPDVHFKLILAFNGGVVRECCWSAVTDSMIHLSDTCWLAIYALIAFAWCDLITAGICVCLLIPSLGCSYSTSARTHFCGSGGEIAYQDCTWSICETYQYQSLTSVRSVRHISISLWLCPHVGRIIYHLLWYSSMWALGQFHHIWHQRTYRMLPIYLSRSRWHHLLLIECECDCVRDFDWKAGRQDHAPHSCSNDHSAHSALWRACGKTAQIMTVMDHTNHPCMDGGA